MTNSKKISYTAFMVDMRRCNFYVSNHFGWVCFFVKGLFDKGLELVRYTDKKINEK